jgi:hypothetical protein
MNGESNIDVLLHSMNAIIMAEPFVYITAESFSDEEKKEAIMIFKEKEGFTLILSETSAKKFKRSYKDRWAMITLGVHSDLNAIGFLAAITARLAQKAISVNAVSAFYHDHLFIPWDKRRSALSTLRSFNKEQ